MIQLAAALKSLYPSAEFAIEDNNIEKIRWFKNEPVGFKTKAERTARLQELNVELSRLQSLQDSTKYQFERKKEYPSIGDQLDDLFKAGLFSEEMAAKIQAIKDKYPKP